MNSAIVLFLKENLQRLFTKSPLFFKVWTFISLVLVLITGVPELVNAISGVITIPELWNIHITTAVAWASRAALFMSMLTTQSVIAASTSGGIPLKQTDAAALPFTAAAEVKTLDKVDVPVAKNVPDVAPVPETAK